MKRSRTEEIIRVRKEKTSALTALPLVVISTTLQRIKRLVQRIKPRRIRHSASTTPKRSANQIPEAQRAVQTSNTLEQRDAPKTPHSEFWTLRPRSLEKDIPPLIDIPLPHRIEQLRIEQLNLAAPA